MLFYRSTSWSTGSGEPIRGCSGITWVGRFGNTPTGQSQSRVETRGARAKGRVRTSVRRGRMSRALYGCYMGSTQTSLQGHLLSSAHLWKFSPEAIKGKLFTVLPVLSQKTSVIHGIPYRFTYGCIWLLWLSWLKYYRTLHQIQGRLFLKIFSNLSLHRVKKTPPILRKL